MNFFGKLISKYFFRFIGLIILLLIINILCFGITFYNNCILVSDTSPENLLETVAADSSTEGLSDQTIQKLTTNHIWAMLLTETGTCLWNINTPNDIPDTYTLSDVAVFSKGYLKGYPVFVQKTSNGLLILGYPKDSYFKLANNYLPINAIKRIPIFFITILLFDLLALFLFFMLSKRKLLKTAQPIIAALNDISKGTPVELSIKGELSPIALSINRTSTILNQQNAARANWISGVSHDIRTPLSMIVGYGNHIVEDNLTSPSTKHQAEIICTQSALIKDLINDLNLVSRLEYDMQPLNKHSFRLAKLIRTYVADLLNGGLADSYSLDIHISKIAENLYLDCDERLMIRALNNLVQNSIKHNPDGCHIKIELIDIDNRLVLSVKDNGNGLDFDNSSDFLPSSHYMDSTDETLNLRHGLGIKLVRQIVKAHNGTLEIKSKSHEGFEVSLIFDFLL